LMPMRSSKACLSRSRYRALVTIFTVIDSYGSELIHPIREGRSPQQIGKDEAQPLSILL